MVNFLLSADSWQSSSWSSENCSIEKNVGGGFTIVDNNIQCSVATAETEAEAHEWLYGEPLNNPEVNEGNWAESWKQSKEETPKSVATMSFIEQLNTFGA